MIYVPVLKAKVGEKNAVTGLSDSTKDCIVPIFEIPNEHIKKANCSFYENNWCDRKFYLDFPHDSIMNGIDDEDFDSWFSEVKKDYLIPVVHLNYDSSRISVLQSTAQNGIALRLTINEIFKATFKAELNLILSISNINETDLIIDAQNLDGDQFDKEIATLKLAIDSIPDLTSFRKVIFLNGSFPQMLKVEKNDLILLPRSETRFYDVVSSLYPDVDFIYSDYCINHWSFFEYINGMQVSFNIRYTIQDYFVIFKGFTAKKKGFAIENIKSACEKLVSSHHFSGENFSSGDTKIFGISEGSIKNGGNATTWRTIGTNHHIEFIVNQLSSQL